MSDGWIIQGEPEGSAPTVGLEYEIRHSRKGTFRGQVLAVRDCWCELLITDGVASAVMSYNVKQEDEIVTVRDCLSIFIPC